MIQIANPIYDCVFKYLIEDTAIAQIFLTALMKRDVTDVVMQPHEYTNTVKDKISILRVDFAAKVRTSDDNFQRVHIEVQKQYVETEIKRFRQYIGTQYNNPDNILHNADRKKDYGIPTVFIYLLGHDIDNIEEPVLYVRHIPMDYYNNEVTKGLPEPFIESLTHDCIFVQLPRLVNTKREGRLFEILRIFDQDYKKKEKRQTLNIDESLFEGDREMERIVHRLVMAAADCEVRQDMNIEGEVLEVFEALDRRDGIIEQQGNELQELGTQIAEKDQQLSEQANLLSEKDNLLSEKDNLLSEKDSLLSEKDKALTACACSLLRKGFSVEQVAEMTTLPIKDVMDIQSEDNG